SKLGRVMPLSTVTLRDFVKQQFVSNVFPALKLSTQDRYRRTFDNHILPALGARRLCDMGTLDLQRFILQKADTGLSWACVDHYRHLLSKIFSTAKKWSYYSGENPAAGVELPEKKSVREKHVLTPEQISQLLSVLGEPVRTMFLLAILQVCAWEKFSAYAGRTWTWRPDNGGWIKLVIGPAWVVPGRRAAKGVWL